MRTEYEIMEALKSYIEDHLDDYYNALPSASEHLGDYKVVIDSPDIDNLPKKDTIWLEFDNGSSEEESTMTDIAAMAVSVHIMCSRENQEKLQLKCWGYFSAFYSLIRMNQNIGGAVDFAMITDWEWFPQAGAKQGIAAIKSTLTFQWQKVFS